MPKAILEFELANKGGQYRLAISDVDNYLRGILKYNSDSYSEEVLAELQKVRDQIHESLNNRDLSI